MITSSLAALLIFLPALGASAYRVAQGGDAHERRQAHGLSAKSLSPQGTGAIRGSLVANTGDPCSTLERCRYLAGKRLRLLGKREHRIVRLLQVVHKLRGSRDGGSSSASSPASIICRVFGSHCSEAIAVARCESNLNVYAKNPAGYWGLFQFGSFARAHYGFAWDAWTQSRAAYRYFLDAGWSPWECRP